MMKKGVYVGCLPADLSLEDRFAWAVEAGFDGIELRADEELISSDEKLRSVADLARRTLPVCSVMAAAGSRPSLTSADPSERAKASELLRLTIRAACLLGSDAVLVIPGVVNETVSYDA